MWRAIVSPRLPAHASHTHINLRPLLYSLVWTGQAVYMVYTPGDIHTQRARSHTGTHVHSVPVALSRLSPSASTRRRHPVSPSLPCLLSRGDMMASLHVCVCVCVCVCAGLLQALVIFMARCIQCTHECDTWFLCFLQALCSVRQ